MKKNIFLLINITLFSIALFASEGEEGHSGGWLEPIWGIPTVVWQSVNLILVFVLFYYLLRVRLPSFFKVRASEIEKELEKAKEEKKIAEEKLQELKIKMSSLEDELKKIKEDALKASEREKEALLKQADETAKRMKFEAEEELKRKEREIEKRITELVVNEAVEKAKEIILKKVDSDDEDSAYKYFLTEFKERQNG